MPRSTSLSDALSSCREQLRDQLTRDFTPESLAQPIRKFATLASREELPPERVLALIKEMIKGLPAMEKKTPGDRAELTARFVETAIKAYYGKGAD